MRTPLTLLSAAFGLLLFSAPAVARPPYKRALADLLSLHNASPLNDCATCHLPPKPGAPETDRPHNAFGARLKAVRAELRKAGKKTDITSRILAVADEDAAKDGVANLAELLSGRAPGDAADKPTAAELAKVPARRAALLASLKGYRWRPFERVERPPLPAVKDPTGCRN